jgi:SAM-dependent methyltransferase
MLDIGCGSGDYLARMRNAGWDVLGLEPSRSAAKRAEDRFGVPIICDSFPSAKLQRASFDLVTAHQVLEHLESPLDALIAMRDLLDSNGKILLTVPNAGSWSARFFGPAWLSWDLPRHLTHFTRQSLTEMAAMAGLEPTVARTLPQGGWIRESAARAKNCDLPPSRSWFVSRQLSGAAARVSAWTGQGDNLLLIARRAGER